SAGRVTFVLPAGDFTLVGTTDTPTDASPSDVRASEEDVEYLLRVVRNFFPGHAPDVGDVVSSWAGIRPLASAGYGSTPSAASREHASATPAPGLLVVTGGKLTPYRSIAEEIVDVAVAELGEEPSPSGTGERPLPGGNGDMRSEVAEAERATGDSAIARRLTAAHGSEWKSVWALAERTPSLQQRVAEGRPYVLAEVVYAARCEWARTLADVLVRRVPIAFESRDHGRAAARTVMPL